MKTKTSSIYVIIICRLDSKRFRFKALQKYKNKTIIEHLINNILSTNHVKRENIIISTSSNKTDDKLKMVAKNLNVKIFRGSKKNIINRVFNTFKKFNIKNAIITSADNPFFLPDVFAKIKNLNNYHVKYIQNLPVGLNLLHCNFSGINKINKNNLTSNNENGFYLYFTNTDLVNKKLIKFNIKKYFKEARFTIDYKKDFIFFKKILFLLQKSKLKIELKNLMKIIRKFPQIKNINQSQQLMYKTNLTENTNLYYLNKYKKKTFLPYV